MLSDNAAGKTVVFTLQDVNNYISQYLMPQNNMLVGERPISRCVKLLQFNFSETVETIITFHSKIV